MRRTPSSSAPSSGASTATAPARAPAAPTPTPSAPPSNAAAAGPGVPAQTASPTPTTAPPDATVAPTGAASETASETAGIVTVAPSTPIEQEAATLADNAMNRDYRAGRHRAAEKKLRQALDLCLKKGCSVPFRARLNRDIGIVYVGGMRRTEAGKDEFATALTADPTVAIAPVFNSRQVNRAFLDVKRSLATEGAVSPAANEPPAAGAVSSEAFVESTPEGNLSFLRNWITLGYQQDFVLHTSTQNVCNMGSRYICYDGNNQTVDFSSGVYNGNEISSTGLRLASGRILLGFERLLSKNFGIGLKVGAVVRGKGVILAGDSSFFMFHGEARLSVYPGSDPFGRTTKVRPYLFASGGVAETDSKISIEVVRTPGVSEQYIAWKRTGKGFASGGLGITFPLTPKVGPFVEARFLRMFEKPSYAMAAMGGMAIGF